MVSRLRDWMNQGQITPLSYFFARFIAEEYRLDEDSVVVFSAALVSERNQQGEPCIDLRSFAGEPLFDADSGTMSRLFEGLEYEDWRSLLQSQPCVGGPGEIAPLILEARRLYLGRFWHYEDRVREAILARLQSEPEIDEARLKEGLARLFPGTEESEEPDWQKAACALAVVRRLAIISGGPGTGKTTTLVKVLALLLEQNRGLRIGLAAPTGKAAARMVESIRERKQQIPVDPAIRARIPEQSSTLHRLLEYDGYRFRVDRDNPLILDCLVIDEASMVDLPLMARLLDALPSNARLILLGDRDQLASVEAGNVLADLCGNGLAIEYSPAFARGLAEWVSVPVRRLAVKSRAPGMADSIALLRTSYRFGADSAIGRLAGLINRGQGGEAQALLQKAGTGQIVWRDMSDQGVATEVLHEAVEQYRHYLEAGNPEQALERVEGFRVLCATRQGPAGVIEINRIIEEGLFPKASSRHPNHYPGKLLMITVNDYETGLYNGDIGLLWADRHGKLKAWFRLSGNQIRSIPVRDLPEYVPAWAMTVHKSQGSEFDQVLMILPNEESHPVVCRELIYTAITRCRKSLSIHASRGAFIGGVNRKLSRSSGLAEKLGWPSG
ncbi:MAG: exodeoxyribonuclease V subunit alpha [Methylococcales bacterium]